MQSLMRATWIVLLFVNISAHASGFDCNGAVKTRETLLSMGDHEFKTQHSGFRRAHQFFTRFSISLLTIRGDQAAMRHMADSIHKCISRHPGLGYLQIGKSLWQKPQPSAPQAGKRHYTGNITTDKYLDAQNDLRLIQAQLKIARAQEAAQQKAVAHLWRAGGLTGGRVALAAGAAHGIGVATLGAQVTAVTGPVGAGIMVAALSGWCLGSAIVNVDMAMGGHGQAALDRPAAAMMNWWYDAPSEAADIRLEAQRLAYEILRAHQDARFN